MPRWVCPDVALPVSLPGNRVGVVLKAGGLQAFVLDYSFDSSEPSDRTGKYADNLVLFQELGNLLIQSTLAGFNTCLFCHGAPQSGKTYTLIGQESDPGMLPRVTITPQKIPTNATWTQDKKPPTHRVLLYNHPRRASRHAS